MILGLTLQVVSLAGDLIGPVFIAYTTQAIAEEDWDEVARLCIWWFGLNFVIAVFGYFARFTEGVFA